MKTTVHIPDSIFEQARKVANREKTTLKALVEEGLRRVIDERKRRGRFQLRRVSFDGRGLQKDLRGTSWEHIRELSYDGRSE